MSNETSGSVNTSTELTDVDRLVRRAGTTLAGLAAVHVAWFLPAAIEAAGDWARGALWTLDPSPEMTGTDAAFWALPGGCAIPLGVLGMLVRREAHRGTVPPAWVGWAVGGWALLASVLTEPSGFPVGVAAAAMLVTAARRERRTGGPRPARVTPGTGTPPVVRSASVERRADEDPAIVAR